MFLKLFRANYSFQMILLLILGILLWLPAFIHPLPIPPPLSPVPIYDWLIGPLRAHLLLATILGFSMLLGEAVILSYILTAHDLAPRNTAIASLIFFLLFSWQPETLTLHPVLFSNIFFFVFLSYFLKVYEQPDPFKEVFSAAFSLGLACVFTLPAYPLFLMIWFGFFVYRVLSWREWFISILGFTLPLLFALTYYFWNDGLPVFITDFKSYFSFPSIQARLSTPVIIIWSGIAFLCLGALIRTLSIIQEKVISIRKNFILITWFFILSLLVLLNIKKDIAFLALIPMMPASILISYHFTSLKKTLYWDIFFSLLLVMIFLYRLS